METVDTPAALRIRLAAELWLFVTPRRRCPEFTVEHDRTASLGHVVQSAGVPLTEVGELRLDGAPASPGDRPHPGATVEATAPRRPQLVQAHRYLLDVHLGTTARRLRLLGVDTAYRNDATDDELVQHAGAERRVLLTQDRGLLRRRALWAGAYVRGAGPCEQLADVLDRFAPPMAPWTRCVSCNGALVTVDKDDVAARLEPGTRRCYDTYARCATCGQVYWRGAHSRRLQRIIAAARAVHPAP